MAEAADSKIKATELELILARWENRHELRQLSRSLPRALMAAALLGLVACAIGYLHFRLAPGQMALINLGLLGLGGVLNLLRTLIFPRSKQEQARHFDLEFGLQERVSTALELLSGRLRTNPEIESRQIADALARARAINARAAIALDFRPREISLLLILLLLLSAASALPLLTGGLPALEPPSPAIEAAREDLKEITEAIAKDARLEEVDRRELLDELEIALERLQEEDISEEEAFAVMSQLGEQLEQERNQLEDTIELDQTAMEAALEALQDAMPPQDLRQEDFESGEMPEAQQAIQELLSQALEELSQDASEMSEEERQAAAEALQQAAQALEQLSPELAQQIQDMSREMEEGGDMQDGVAQAQQELSQQSAQQQQDQEAMEMLEQQAQQAQDAAEDISQQQAGPQSGPPQQSETGQQQSGQQSDQQSDQARPGSQQGNQQSDRNRPGEGPAQGSNPDSLGAGAGAGESDPSNQSRPGAGGFDQGADTNNRTTGARRIAYEAIYNPSGISGGGSEEIRLQTDAGDKTLVEGEFDDNPLGESRVSYDTVFSDYQNTANRALESDYVPLGLRDVVREYFTSLDPNA